MKRSPNWCVIKTKKKRNGRAQTTQDKVSPLSRKVLILRENYMFYVFGTF